VVTDSDIDALLLELDAQARALYPFTGIGVYDAVQREKLREVVRRWPENLRTDTPAHPCYVANCARPGILRGRGGVYCDTHWAERKVAFAAYPK